MIEAFGLSKRYGGRVAVDGVSLEGRPHRRGAMSTGTDSVPQVQERAPGSSITNRLGLWAAVLVTLLNVAFTASLIVSPPAVWKDLDTFASGYGDIQILPPLIAFLCAPVFVALMTAIYHSASQDQRVLGFLGVTFAVVYASLVGINYFVQMTVVRQRILAGELAGLEAFVMANPRSLMLAVDTVGYFFLALSVLAMTPLFGTTSAERGIRWSFVATGALGILGTAGFVMQNDALGLGILVSGIPFLVASVLLIFVFKRAASRAA